MRPPLPNDDLLAVFDRTREYWSCLRGARFFFTGGTGFVGRWLLESLFLASDVLDLGLEVTVLTRSPASFLERCPALAARCTLLPGDVRDFAFPSGRFDFIIHAAGEAGDTADDAVRASLRVLDCAHRVGAAQILFTSSGAVYGEQPRDLPALREDDSFAPRTPYGQGKLMAEHLLRTYADEHGYGVKIARLFALVGPGLPLDRHFAAGNLLGDALAGRPLRVTSDGSPVRSWLYAADMAAWLWTILFGGQSGRPYNVGSDYSLPIASFARGLGIVAANPPLAVEITGAPDGKPLPARYVPDLTRARTELALTVNYPLPEALRRTLAWHRAATA